MKLIVTTDANDRIDLNLGEMIFECRDSKGDVFARGSLTLKPDVVPGEPLVLGTSEGTVKLMGVVKGVVYR